MKYFKKLVGEKIYLSPRSTEDAEIFTEWMNDIYHREVPRMQKFLQNG